ncbi:MAG: hypothetical protein ACRDZN_13440, partial [Acidimicrobiales bacterium]
VASVSGLWAGTVVPVDGDAVRVTGSGAPGGVDLVVRADPGRTALTVEGTVDGPLASVGSAVLAAAVRRTAQDLLTGVAQIEPETTADRGGAPVPQPRASLAPAAGDQRKPWRSRRPQRELVAAAGVVLAIVIRHSSRRRRRGG